jgi:hypothetical protein
MLIPVLLVHLYDDFKFQRLGLKSTGNRFCIHKKRVYLPNNAPANQLSQHHRAQTIFARPLLLG